MGVARHYLTHAKIRSKSRCDATVTCAIREPNLTVVAGYCCRRISGFLLGQHVLLVAALLEHDAHQRDKRGDREDDGKGGSDDGRHRRDVLPGVGRLVSSSRRRRRRGVRPGGEGVGASSVSAAASYLGDSAAVRSVACNRDETIEAAGDGGVAVWKDLGGAARRGDGFTDGAVWSANKAHQCRRRSLYVCVRSE